MIDSPGSVLSLVGCAVWLPIAVWVYSLITWSIMDEIEPWIGLPGAVLGIALGVAIMLQPNEQLTPLLIIGLVSMMIAFPALRSYHNKREFAKIDLQSMEDAYEQLSFRSGNLGAAMRIARIAYRRGWVGHAVAVAEPVVNAFPKEIVSDELRELRSWKAQMQQHHNHSLMCLECGVANPPGNLWCKSCGAPVLLAHAKGAWLGSSSARRLMAAWLAGVVSLIGIPLAASVLPGPAAAVVIVIFLAGSTVVVWRAFRPDRRTASRS